MLFEVSPLGLINLPTVESKSGPESGIRTGTTDSVTAEATSTFIADVTVSEKAINTRQASSSHCCENTKLYVYVCDV